MILCNFFLHTPDAKNVFWLEYLDCRAKGKIGFLCQEILMPELGRAEGGGFSIMNYRTLCSLRSLRQHHHLFIRIIFISHTHSSHSFKLGLLAGLN